MYSNPSETTDSQASVSFLASSSSLMVYPGFNGSRYSVEDDEFQPLLGNTNGNNRRRSVKEKLDTIPGAWIEDEEEDNDDQLEQFSNRHDGNIEEIDNLVSKDTEDEVDSDGCDSGSSSSDCASSVFIRTVPDQPPIITTTYVLDDNTTSTFNFGESSCSNNHSDIEWLKQAIASLKEEQEKLQQTNHIVKKSIQIVAKKRSKAAAAQTCKRNDGNKGRAALTDMNEAEAEETVGSTIGNEELELDKVNSDDRPIEANGNNNVFIIVTKTDFNIPSTEELRAAGIDDSWEWITTYV